MALARAGSGDQAPGMALAAMPTVRELAWGDLYRASPRAPELVSVPGLAFIMIDGHGDPNNSTEYRDALQAVYSLSYTLKFAIKKELGIDYHVGALEGLWWADDMLSFSIGRKTEHGLNLVAGAPDGSFAAHVGLTLDEANRHGIVEPVCTHPDHRRAGLARHLLLTGLDKLRARNARTVQVDTGEQAASNALYAACGFTDAYHQHAWRKRVVGTR